MGALPWQALLPTPATTPGSTKREGRYTGVSANWYITKQLVVVQRHRGRRLGRLLPDDPAHGVDYLTQISYWLDEDAKKTKVWTTLLTGLTGFTPTATTTVVELGLQHNYKGIFIRTGYDSSRPTRRPIFFTPPPGYQERCLRRVHLSAPTSRKRWMSTPASSGTRTWTAGGYLARFRHPAQFPLLRDDACRIDYHPNKWLLFRPEIRYDYATNPAFGENNNKSCSSLRGRGTHQVLKARAARSADESALPNSSGRKCQRHPAGGSRHPPRRYTSLLHPVTSLIVPFVGLRTSPAVRVLAGRASRHGKC